jgi:biopolymer transport protein ExbD
MQSGSGEDDVVQGINVTPLVDITLVLLVIFMVTATFVTEQGLKITLPKAATQEAPPTPALTITVGKGSTKGTVSLRLMKLTVDLAGLRANLEHEATLNPNVKVVIKADKDLAYGQVAEILDTVKLSGISRCALILERK